MERSFEKVAIDDEITLKFNRDVLDCDYLINIPVLKTHSQTVVSLGIKNLKGLIDIPSRKKCHSPDPEKDLHYYVSRLADKLSPMFTLIDGIYTNEMGPTCGNSVGNQIWPIVNSAAFAAQVDPEACTGCGTCTEHCHSDAISLNKDSVSVVDGTRCIGCGVCARFGNHTII